MVSGYVCIDASVAAKWVLFEELRSLARALYRDSIAKEMTIIGPPHMSTEVVNTIRRRVARGFMTANHAEELLGRFLQYQLTPAAPPGLHQLALRVAEAYNRPGVYDSHYLALAQIYECDFWTADQRLLNALNGRLPFVRSLSDYQPAGSTT